MNVGFISLGCSKNLVDTENTIGLFKKNKFHIVNDVKDADIIVINTCGFIESAKQEAVDTILEMSKIKIKSRKKKYLIVMGCLVQRYKESLEKTIPEVDLFIKFDEYENMWERIANLVNSKDNKTATYLDRVVTTGRKTAYIKIAEGCSNNCTYCAIPMIRGKYISRKIEDVITEARKLADEGIEEIILIAQDTTKYGTDIYKKPRLQDLLKRLCKIEGIKWIRFMYAYPESLTDEMIKIIKNEKKICKYFDMPIQHIANPVLKRMNRKGNAHLIKTLIKKIRKEIPEAIIRTTLIVGFPGETEKDFEELYTFVEKTKFDKLGVFKYSKEEGTPAELLPEQVHHMTKEARYNKIMELQNGISEENIKKHIGKTYEVLIENKVENEKIYAGRTYMDSLDVDGLVYVKSSKNIIGEFVKVLINDTEEYDLIGEIV